MSSKDENQDNLSASSSGPLYMDEEKEEEQAQKRDTAGLAAVGNKEDAVTDVNSNREEVDQARAYRPSRRNKDSKKKKALNSNEDGSNNAVALTMAGEFLYMNEAHQARSLRPSRLPKEKKSKNGRNESPAEPRGGLVSNQKDYSDEEDSTATPGAFKVPGIARGNGNVLAPGRDSSYQDWAPSNGTTAAAEPVITAHLVDESAMEQEREEIRREFAEKPVITAHLVDESEIEQEREEIRREFAEKITNEARKWYICACVSTVIIIGVIVGAVVVIVGASGPPPPLDVASSLPSPYPTPKPPSPAPTDAYELGLTIGCTPPLNAESCDAIPTYTTICQARPFQMIFRYNGGDCSGSFNSQPVELSNCSDYRGGPPKEDGTVSYIVATALGGGQVHFAGFVEVGEKFAALAHDGDQVFANTYMTIYDPRDFGNAIDIIKPENILQTLYYHSSCSRDLFLKDRFGSVELLAFENEYQGTVTSFHNATLTFSIEAPVEIEGGSTELTALTVITNIDNGNGGIYNLTDKVAGVIVTPEISFSVTVMIPLDLTVRQKYTASSTIVGKGCFGTDVFEFEAGNLARSAAPTISPAQ